MIQTFKLLLNDNLIKIFDKAIEEKKKRREETRKFIEEYFQNFEK